MPLHADEIVHMITASLPGASVEMQDLRGDGDHYHATVTCPAFEGLPRIKQHQMVYAALQGKMGNELHALSLTTRHS